MSFKPWNFVKDAVSLSSGDVMHVLGRKITPTCTDHLHSMCGAGSCVLTFYIKYFYSNLGAPKKGSRK